MKRRQLLTTAGLAGLGWVATSGTAHAAAPGTGKRVAWTTTPVELSDPYLPQTYLDDVDSTPAGTWAVGVTLLDGWSYTRPLILRWQDTSWVETPAGLEVPATLNAVAVVSADEVWAVGSDNTDPNRTTPLALRWDGRAWSQVPPPSVPAGAFASVVAAPDGSAWASGWADIDGIEHGVVYQYANGGWELRSSGLESTINGNALLVLSATDVWLALNPGLAHFDGKTWTMVTDFPGDGSQILTNFTAASPHDIWASGVDHTLNGERPLVVHYDGTAWSTVPVPDVSGQLYDVALWHGRAVAVGERFTDRPDGTTLNQPWVLEHKRGGFVQIKAPSALSTGTARSTTGVLTGIVAGPSRLWTVGVGNDTALTAYSL